MDWRSQVGEKFTSAAEAVKVVKSGRQVGIAPFTCTPFTLCEALYARRAELESLDIDHAAGLFAWLRPGEENGFTVRDNYATPLNREMVHAGKVDYLPIGRRSGAIRQTDWRRGGSRAGLRPPSRRIYGPALSARQAGLL